jgi:hypothetical protein
MTDQTDQTDLAEPTSQTKTSHTMTVSRPGIEVKT